MRINKYVTAKMVAEAAGCSTIMVRKVWSGKRNSEKKKGEAVEVATMLLQDCIYRGIEKAKDLINKVQAD